MAKATKTTKNKAKKLGIRLTATVNGKRVSKSEAVLKSQIKSKERKVVGGRHKGKHTVAKYCVKTGKRLYPKLKSYPRKKRTTKKKK
jgi:hypothetical protein